MPESIPAPRGVPGAVPRSGARTNRSAWTHPCLMPADVDIFSIDRRPFLFCLLSSLLIYYLAFLALFPPFPFPRFFFHSLITCLLLGVLQRCDLFSTCCLPQLLLACLLRFFRRPSLFSHFRLDSSSTSIQPIHRLLKHLKLLITDTCPHQKRKRKKIYPNGYPDRPKSCRTATLMSPRR